MFGEYDFAEEKLKEILEISPGNFRLNRGLKREVSIRQDSQKNRTMLEILWWVSYLVLTNPKSSGSQ